MTGSPSHTVNAPRSPSHRAGLIVIAAYKLLGALLFMLVGVGAIKLLHKDIDDLMWHALIEVLHWNPESRFVNFVFEKAELLNDPILKRIGFAAFCYAAVGIVEAIGLYLEKAWAEFLTVFITASFLPIEIRELIVRVNWFRAGLLVANALVLVYLLFLLGERAANRARSRHATAAPHPAQEP